MPQHRRMVKFAGVRAVPLGDRDSGGFQGVASPVTTASFGADDKGAQRAIAGEQAEGRVESAAPHWPQWWLEPLT